MKTLEAFPPLGGRPERYPWDAILDGRIQQLTQGEDYTSKTKTIVANARQQAKRRGGTVRTRLVEDGGREAIVLQFRAE